MSLNSEALAYLASKGLGLDEIIEFARLSERKKDPTNAERQARYRASRKDGKVTRYSNGVSPPIEEYHTPQPDISPDGESQSQPARVECAAVSEAWNGMAKAAGLPICSKMTGKRLRSCQARLRNDGFEAIQQAIEHVPKSAFLRGDAGNWAGATIDFILKPDSVTAILEGKYDDRPSNKIRGGSEQGARSNLARAIDEGIGFLDAQTQVS